jgi:hypothetical protein
MSIGVTRVLAGSLLALGVLIVPMSAVRATDEASILEKVRSARIAADHEAIAKYYDAQAGEARRKAADHKQMAESYRGVGTAIGKGSGASAIPQHCESLVKAFEGEATHYEAMAQAHRDLAKAAK